MNVHIMCGISGSGKSTLTRKLCVDKPLVVVASADSYFETLGRFDPKFLGKAHAQCLRLYVEALRNERDTIIVDNTNCSVGEIAPYIALADAYDALTRVHYFDVPLEVCIQRNAQREGMKQVPERVIRAQHDRFAIVYNWLLNDSPHNYRMISGRS